MATSKPNDPLGPTHLLARDCRGLSHAELKTPGHHFGRVRIIGRRPVHEGHGLLSISGI